MHHDYKRKKSANSTVVPGTEGSSKVFYRRSQ